MAKKKKWLVFVSHSGEDTWVARQIAREISDRGATPFLDEADIDVGAENSKKTSGIFWIRQTSYLFCLHRGLWIDRMSGSRLERHGNVEFRSSWCCTVCPRKNFRLIPMHPVFLKKRDIIRLNDLDKYLKQLTSQTHSRKKRNG